MDVDVKTFNVIQLSNDVATHIARCESADGLLLRIHRVANAIDNVYAHRITIESELLPYFSPDPMMPKNIFDILAHFGVNTNTIAVTYATAAAACRQGSHNIARICAKLLLGNITRTCPPSHDETPILHKFPHPQPTSTVTGSKPQPELPARTSPTPVSCGRLATKFEPDTSRRTPHQKHNALSLLMTPPRDKAIQSCL
ncbi:hypothetical protein Y032_0366g12 [Ancylostoma ceylanicum]|uniref:Uncharacterized protein n=1 Tax=Ancylostoma ceylanicum TaxID=53326 RepID=A0A016RUR1_9BILA|nr:hypothetical protein Y032_0366g12 [Ancylostoma ceylanicum]